MAYLAGTMPQLIRPRRDLIWGVTRGTEPQAVNSDGQIYFVYGIDGGIGSDDNDGLSPEYPFLTLTHALAQCDAGRQDYIVVQDYWQPTGETWPISVNVNNVHIIGMVGAGTQMPILTPTGNTAGISIAADRVEIANLCINGGAAHGCIENNPGAPTARWGTLIRDCWFAVLGTAQDGIKNVAASDNVYLEVLRCRFGFAITRDGIRIEHNATRCMIGDAWGASGNIFDRVAGIAINVVGSAADLGIFSNVFSLLANTAGDAITLSAGTAGCTIDGNRANFGDTTMGASPYADGAGAGANNWLLNYQGITAVMPT